MLLLENCLQTCMTYTIAECTVNKLLMMDRRTDETWKFSCQNKFVKFVHLVGFITKKLNNLLVVAVVVVVSHYHVLFVLSSELCISAN